MVSARCIVNNIAIKLYTELSGHILLQQSIEHDNAQLGAWVREQASCERRTNCADTDSATYEVTDPKPEP